MKMKIQIQKWLVLKTIFRPVAAVIVPLMNFHLKMTWDTATAASPATSSSNDKGNLQTAMNDRTSSRRKIGGRSYKHSEAVMQQCLEDIKTKRLSSRKAAVVYGIPRSSIILKMKAIRENNVAPPGRSCVFTSQEEESFVQHTIKLNS
ncbi:uncharacterized protein LOC126473523 isoform X2 [Schistocerca serialis cubense]|uniref:uncharacterized protein LOC126473523 isoform X2 n=1 Tax=Schistocerca serialis cubense TaxID=2023355 RepID=UPI00214E4F51|nr:uncharacterized protein LOC126473523 isoform X2 [Schistocerca serialis cubense]